jgi:hypothetical protein
VASSMMAAMIRTVHSFFLNALYCITVVVAMKIHTQEGF